MDANRVKAAAEAIGNNFRRADVRNVEPELPSKAEAMGLAEPPLTPEQRAGARVEATLVNKRWLQKIKAHEAYLAEKAKYEQERDAAIWEKVLERRAASL